MGDKFGLHRGQFSTQMLFYYGHRLFYCWNICKMWVPIILVCTWSCRLEALSCCMTQLWRRFSCWTFHSRVFWYTDELMVESKYPQSCGWKTRQNHHPSTTILTSWYVFVLLRSPHMVLRIMATHSQRTLFQKSFCHLFPLATIPNNLYLFSLFSNCTVINSNI